MQNKYVIAKQQIVRTARMYGRKKIYFSVIAIGIVCLLFLSLGETRVISSDVLNKVNKPLVFKSEDSINSPLNQSLNVAALNVIQQKKNNSVKLKLDDLKPADHIDAVRIEQDGQINVDFKKEIFFGEHEFIDSLSEDQKKDKLKEIFRLVDSDSNNELSLVEMQHWITLKVEEHFTENHENNERIFKGLDLDNNNLIDWDEFHYQFLIAKEHDKTLAEKQIKDYNAISLSEDEKDELVKYKFRWTDAEDEPRDNKLTLEEFKEFRHPEKSTKMIKRMVDDFLENLDADKDGKISEDEFAAVPAGDDHHHQQIDTADQSWQRERRKEFKEIIDTDGDGIVTQQELRDYIDPRNKQHALIEANNLLQVADSDKNGSLNLEEVVDNIDLFFGSKFVDPNRALHEEF